MKFNEPKGYMPITFLGASKEDIPEIQKLARRIWEEAYREILSDDQINYMLELMYSEKVIVQELRSGVVWDIIVNKNQPCGFLSYTFGKDNSVKLSKIYIMDEARGKSIAAESISRISQYARDNGKEWLDNNRLRDNRYRQWIRHGRLYYGMPCEAAATSLTAFQTISAIIPLCILYCLPSLFASSVL